MSHLESFRAIRYRGIDGVRLDRLAAVNLITGPNGAGKTSLAEAIWLFNGRFTPALPWNAHVQRSRRRTGDPLARLVSEGAVELAGTEGGAQHEWKAAFEPMPTVGDATADSDQRAVASAKPPTVNGPAWPVPPQGRLRIWLDGEVITDPDGQPFILGTTTENERLPLQALGGGMTRLFRLFVAFHDFKGGLVLIDEIENGLHHLVLPNLWRQVQAMTGELDVQIFATTHSRECIDAALDSFSGEANRLAIHVLARHGDQVRALTYTGETLEAARDIRLDLR